MTATIIAFVDSPDEDQGLARDMRVRWALEEVGQPYDVRLLTMEQHSASVGFSHPRRHLIQL